MEMEKSRFKQATKIFLPGWNLKIKILDKIHINPLTNNKFIYHKKIQKWLKQSLISKTE